MRVAIVSVLALAAFVALRLGLGTIGRESFPWPPAIVDDSIAGGAARFVSVPDSPWILFVGGSSLYFGLDAPSLPFENRKQTVNRGLPADFYALVSWDLLTVPARNLPTTVVVSLNPTSIVDRRRFDGESPCATQEMTERVEVRDFASMGCPAEMDWTLWLERVDRWHARREMVARAAGWWLSYLLGRPQALPRPEDGLEIKVGTDPAVRDKRLDRFVQSGMLEEMPDPVEVRALELLHAAARERGVRVMGVLLPENSRKLALYPDAARLAFEEVARRTSDVLLDLRSALPDDALNDDSHPNERGRVILSDMLGRALAGELTSYGKGGVEP